MADINESIEALTRQVANQATVIDGVKTLIAGLKQQLEDLEGSLDAAGEQEAALRIDALITALDANTTRLAEALVANTEPGV